MSGAPAPDNSTYLISGGADGSSWVIFTDGNAPGRRYRTLREAMEVLAQSIPQDFPSGMEIRIEVNTALGEPAPYEPVDS